MVIFNAADHKVTTIDSREKAPQGFRADSFIDPATGKPIPFPEQVTSGLGVGVPGTLLAWESALDRFGTRLERRMTQAQIKALMEKAGLRDIRFRDAAPFWCAVGRKT